MIPELQEPRYRPDLNEGLGGTIELADDYLFPVKLPAGKVRTILEEQAKDDDLIRGSQFPFFSIRVNEDQQYDLLYSFGEDEPVDAIALYDSKNREVAGFYEIEELVEKGSKG